MLVDFDNGRSCELAVAFALIRPDPQQQPYSLAEVLRLRNRPEAAFMEGQQLVTQSSLEAALKKAASLASEFASEELQGNEKTFTNLANQRAAEAMDYGLARDLRAARLRADRAWQEKDFATVVSVYRPFLSHLSPSEVKRLEFASRHTEGGLEGHAGD
jgi:hypothetical protein